MSNPGRGAHALTLVGASAGSGKTHRLTEVVVEAVAPGGQLAIDPASLAAVTYTRRAATELAGRIRRSLIGAGAHERAQRLPLAYLGTVHSVCLRLVQEFALDAGLSPQVDVLPGDEARSLREALEWGLEPDFRERLEALAERLQLRWDGLRSRTDWVTPVQDVMTLARSNRIAAGALPAMGERSADRLLALLGPVERDGDALDRELVTALEKAEGDLANVDDGQKNTATALRNIQDALRAIRSGRFLWPDWVRLQHLAPAKKLRPLVDPVIEVATRVDRHPRLQADVRELTQHVYEAARLGLEAYDAWKKRRRVVDFVDMIDRALTLLERSDVQRELRDRLRLLVVDEFQDTSPVQLALFVRLHQIAGRSTWVGDRKQCIFEFAGADPGLMEAVTKWAATSGGETPRLEVNWRSRPELVEACSHLFAGAFSRHGYGQQDVRMGAKRSSRQELASLPPLGVWSLQTANQGQDAAALAEGVRRLLDSPEATPVEDRETKQVRPLRPGDIAVLVYTNKEAVDLASQLAQRGVRATVARAGLLSTPEGAVVEAALSVLIDSRDALAQATLEALTGFGGVGPDAWLGRRIADQEAIVEAKERGEEVAAPAPSALVARLEALRPQLDALSPGEALDGVLTALDLATLCVRWPDPAQRLSNLDALRALTAAYEEHCAHRREAGTIAGLLRFFEEAAKERLVRDEEIASDDQHVGGDRAVTIATYHRSKGLEWPVVVLSSLDRGERRGAFEVCPETDQPAFDAADPLGGRWIRYWPWPFGQLQTTRLAEVAESSPEGQAVALREERERVRLLYVGFTRARDHLILAARASKKGPAVQWLEELMDAGGRPLLTLPVAPDASGVSTVEMCGADQIVKKVSARHWILGVGEDPPARLGDVDSHVWFVRPAGEPRARAAYWISPSNAGAEWPELSPLVVGKTESIGDRLPLGKRGDVEADVIGNTLHAFLAADVAGLRQEQRRACAQRLLTAASLGDLLAPDAMLQAGDQLRRWVESRWPGAVWRREYPISAVLETPRGTRRVQGTIDLMLETSDGVVIVDHKSYPGGASSWVAKAGEFASQLAAYAHVLRVAGKQVREAYVHFAVGAGVVQLHERGAPEC